MQNNQLNRLLQLINRTGDRLVVLDRETDATVVMMEVEEYEKLLNGGPRLEDMSEADILDKINREVAVWREKNLANEASAALEDDLEDLAPVSGVDTTETIENEPKYVENLANISQKEEKKEVEESITINPIAGPEEELKDVPHDGEEEQFYLEPV